MKLLLKKIERLELRILIYSDRDQIVTRELEKKLRALNMELLNKMSV